MQTTMIKKLSLVAVVAMVLAVLVPILAQRGADAAALTQVLVRFDRMKVSTPTTGTVCAKPTTTSTEASVQVAFPAGYTVSTCVYIL